MRARTFGGALLVSTAIVTFGASASFAQDAFMDESKAYIETVTAPVTAWTGPTTGPKAQPDKLVIYVSDDQRNGGARGVGDGAKEAAEAIGCCLRGHQMATLSPKRRNSTASWYP
jgi:ribose transport system substrate-binding protein